LTRPTRQLKLNVNHVRRLSTPAPRITYHDKRRDRDIAFYDDEQSDPLREEREQDPFQFKPEFQRRRESAERFAEQPIQDLSELQRTLIKYEPRRKSIKASVMPLAEQLDDPDHVVPVMALRDMCTCPRCVDQSTRQKLFSTVDISPKITLRTVTEVPNGVEIEWSNDIPGFDKSHKSVFTTDMFDAMAARGSSKTLPSLPARRLWTDSQFRNEAPDLTYEAYMEDDTILYEALQQLHSYGLLFLKDVPESPDSVSRIVQRIGPLKNTFYGETWDVRSVPQAKNVAYTSQDLGFHMDLMYMEQPPHLQFLHCIRSSAAGGASLFTDSFKAISELFYSDEDAFCELEKRLITFHYDHIDSHYYQQSRPLIELAPLSFGGVNFTNFKSLRTHAARKKSDRDLRQMFKLEDYLEAVSWAPPFQAPFQTANSHLYTPWKNLTSQMEDHVRHWHPAARKFNDIIHKEENIHERMMKPGECVLFDNRRVLHARKAFEVADAGKERWLRGAYLDKDPFISKLRVLTHRFEKEQRGLDSQAARADEEEVREAEAQAA
jgi:alpha-ketoglutarate-dependent taurine dioxygenase